MRSLGRHSRRTFIFPACARRHACIPDRGVPAVAEKTMSRHIWHSREAAIRAVMQIIYPECLWAGIPAGAGSLLVTDTSAI